MARPIGLVVWVEEGFVIRGRPILIVKILGEASLGPEPNTPETEKTLLDTEQL